MSASLTLIENITVDAYGAYEQLSSFVQAFEDAARPAPNRSRSPRLPSAAGSTSRQVWSTSPSTSARLSN